MKILLCTPCYGGQVYASYVTSLLSTMPRLGADGHEVGLHMQYGESLIPRARNACAKAMLDEGYDKLMFIDADISWGYDQLKLLLESDAKIIGGTYCIKNFPITPNFNPLPHQKDLFGNHRQEGDYRAWAQKYADPKTGEAIVEHIPTGFMLIDRAVFTALSYRVKQYNLFFPEKKRNEQFYEFFPSGAHLGGEYESEDWAFCRLAREAGFKITLQSRVVVSHLGLHSYNLGQTFTAVTPAPILTFPAEKLDPQQGVVVG